MRHPPRHLRRPLLASLLLASVLLASVLAVAGVAAAAAAAPGPPYQGRRLVDVLAELELVGLETFYSSAVVDSSLRVPVEPVAREGRALLAEILDSLGLVASAGPGDLLVILPGGQPRMTLTGRVIARADGAAVAGAEIRLGGGDRRATTDAGGVFHLGRVEPGAHDLTVAADGFLTAEFRDVVARLGAAPLVLEIRRQPRFVSALVVSPSRRSVTQTPPTSPYGMTADEADLAPDLGGDLGRVIELLPGVVAADNSAAIHVRGSAADDVAVILDGLELYDPFHLRGLQSPFSVVDSNLVERVDLFGGGFTAELGDRHGGFVEIATLEPTEGDRIDLELGTINGRAAYRTVFGDGVGSLLVSGRVWYPEAFRDTTELGSGEDLQPWLADLYLKTVYRLGPGHRLSLHALSAYDRLDYTEVGEDINEHVDALNRNSYVWLRAESDWSDALRSEAMLSGGRIQRRRDGIAAVSDRVVVIADDREADFLGLRYDLTWQGDGDRAVKAGVDLRWLTAEYRYSAVIEGEPSSRLELDPDGVSLAVHGGYRARLGAALTFELGVRWDHQNYTDDDQLSPRLHLVWQAADRTELRLAAGRFAQSQRIYELDVADGETAFRGAETSDEVELSVQHRLRSGLGLRVDAYYRWLDDLRPRYENLFEPIELFPEVTTDRIRIAPESARLTGAELQLRGRTGEPVVWWLSYVLASADDVIDGARVARSWDQTHEGKFLIGYRGDGWSVALSGTLHSGWPTTPVIAEQVTQPDGSSEIVTLAGARNSIRIPGYARLDLQASRWLRLGGGTLALQLGVANLTDRRNQCCLNEVRLETRPDGSVEAIPERDTWLGFTPSFSVRWSFP